MGDKSPKKKEEKKKKLKKLFFHQHLLQLHQPKNQKKLIKLIDNVLKNQQHLPKGRCFLFWIFLLNIFLINFIEPSH